MNDITYRLYCQYKQCLICYDLSDKKSLTYETVPLSVNPLIPPLQRQVGSVTVSSYDIRCPIKLNQDIIENARIARSKASQPKKRTTRSSRSAPLLLVSHRGH